MRNNKDLFSLEGRIALVTGASSGIGQHMAKTLAAAGADVIIVGRNLDRLEETKVLISEKSAEVFSMPADLQLQEEVDRVGRECANPFGAPDILINAAGINLREAPDNISWESWDQTININLSIPFFLARTLVEGMRQKGFGNIINIASLQSYRAFANSAAYGASKGGIAQLTRAMAEAWSKDGIVTNAIAPGFFPTALTQAVYDDPELLAGNAAKTAIGRNGEMDDLDGATIFLASRASAYITGQVLAVDGGFTAK
jgi:NAD(P)-dependent dehydrogenase (short-subunit alcohol dehydrogenase family)|tara:strand:+ start:886 stop:1656 length:771 start_codon:yes stop_codon:yes gene_type:complete